MMNRKISFCLVLITVFLMFSGCGKPQPENDKFEVKADEIFTVSIELADSGDIKSMALSLYLDDDAFEVVDGEWLNHKAVIADFNKTNKDAAIAFKEDTNYCGEIFAFTVKAKKDLTIIDDMIIVEAILKNGEETIECKGIELSYTK